MLRVCAKSSLPLFADLAAVWYGAREKEREKAFERFVNFGWRVHGRVYIYMGGVAFLAGSPLDLVYTLSWYVVRGNERLSLTAGGK